MEHLSQLEQKSPVVTRREHKGRRDDKMAKRESLGSFSMRDKSWRTSSPEMYVCESLIQTMSARYITIILRIKMLFLNYVARSNTFHRKRLSCSESLYMEGDFSPPMGARRRFSALMDTHRFAAPQEGDGEFSARQGATKTPGPSVEGATAPSSPSANEQRNAGKEVMSTSASKGAGELRKVELKKEVLMYEVRCSVKCNFCECKFGRQAIENR